MRLHLPIALVVLLATSCIQEIDLTTPNPEELLIAEGTVTNLEGYTYLKLSKTVKYTANPNSFSSINPLVNAQVNLFDETDQLSYPFRGDIKGLYKPIQQDFKGLVGHEYSIRINVDEELYTSTPEKLRPTSPIDSVYYEYVREDDKIEIYLDSQDSIVLGQYYLWEWDGAYQINSNLPDPGGDIGADTVACCPICFINVSGSGVNIHEDTYSNGNSISRVKITEIPTERPTDYLINVRQYSLTLEAFEFYNLLKLQSQSQGGLFDPQNNRIVGNIKNEKKPKEIVLGYFNVSGGTESFAQVNRRPFYTRTEPIFINGDCRQIVNADTLKPTNWIM